MLAVVLVIMLTGYFLPRVRADTFGGQCRIFDDNETSLWEGTVVLVGYGTEMQFSFTHVNNPPGTGFTKHIGPSGRSYTVFNTYP